MGSLLDGPLLGSCRACHAMSSKQPSCLGVVLIDNLFGSDATPLLGLGLPGKRHFRILKKQRSTRG